MRDVIFSLPKYANPPVIKELNAYLDGMVGVKTLMTAAGPAWLMPEDFFKTFILDTLWRGRIAVVRYTVTRCNKQYISLVGPTGSRNLGSLSEIGEGVKPLSPMRWYDPVWNRTFCVVANPQGRSVTENAEAELWHTIDNVLAWYADNELVTAACLENLVDISKEMRPRFLP